MYKNMKPGTREPLTLVTSSITHLMPLFFFCTKDSESQQEFTSPRNRVRYVKTLAYSLGSPMVCASIMISVFVFVRLAILRVCMQTS